MLFMRKRSKLRTMGMSLPFSTSLPVFRIFLYHIIREIPAGSFGNRKGCGAGREKCCSHSA